MADRQNNNRRERDDEFNEKVVAINRVAKVVKGGQLLLSETEKDT